MADSVDSGITQDTTSDEFLDPCCDSCKNQKKYLKVVSYCPTCVEYFCKDCDRAHANFQIMKKHRLQYGTEMPTCEADKPPKFQDCQIHANAVRDWFCINHNIMICSKCKDQHDGCFINSADDMKQLLRESGLCKFESEVSNCKNEASIIRSEIEINISKIEQNKACMLAKVETEYKNTTSKLEQQFKASIDDINKRSSEHIATLTDQIASLTTEIENYDTVLENIKRETKSKLDTKLFVKMQTLVENANESVKTVHEVANGIKSVDLKFIEDEKWEQFLSSDHKFGRVDETISQNTIEASLHHISFLPYSRSLSKFIGVNFQKFKFKKEHTQKSFVVVAVDI